MKPLQLSLFIILFFGFSGRITAQDAPQMAILTKGPLYTEGIPFLRSNGLPAWTGRYLVGETEIVTYFSEEPLLIPEAWGEFSCDGEVYRESRFRDGEVFYIQSIQGWGVFIYCPPELPDPCLFLKWFYNRLNYFMGISSTFSLPAVIELK